MILQRKKLKLDTLVIDGDRAILALVNLHTSEKTLSLKDNKVEYHRF